MSRPPPIRLLLVDDHPIVRTGLRLVEQIAGDIRIVGEAATVDEAWLRVRELLPHVVLLDLRLSDGDGLDLCRRTKLHYPNVRILCLTSYADPPLVLAALEAGVDGYLLKHRDARRIADAVREVTKGEPVFDPALGQDATPPAAAGTAAGNPLSVLSPGELRVLSEVARGLTDKEVSTALRLSVKTVRHYLDRVFSKLGVHTRTQAALQFAAHPLPPYVGEPSGEST
ncbi:MAG: response regulator transcription factor [Verrucomicrobiales bacterium]|nr:response regulator transcription factor [Verrucomicrobiales bacterium]